MIRTITFKRLICLLSVASTLDWKAPVLAGAFPLKFKGSMGNAASSNNLQNLKNTQAIYDLTAGNILKILTPVRGDYSDPASTPAL